MEDLTGKQIGRYQIVAPLGEGGMAAVYKAYQPGMDRYVALKILPRHFASDPKFIGRFDQEAKVVAKLQHPHILPIFDYGEDDGYTYIVMPFINGGTLAEKLQGDPLIHDEMIRVVSQVGDALDYAHGNGVLHRDIKPSNIMIDDRGNCLLTDFGIAKMIESTEKFTQTGGIIGTPVYMSPEQGTGATLDGRSDIYSLGVILYEMATGQPPFSAETPLAVVVKHMHDPLKPPREINPDIPESIERIIFKCLAKNKDDRYQSAGDLVDALKPATSTAVRKKLEAETHEFSAYTMAVEPAEETLAMLETDEEPEAATVPDLEDDLEPAAETVAVLEDDEEPATLPDMEDDLEPAAATVAILEDDPKSAAATVAILEDAVEPAAETVAIVEDRVERAAETMAVLGDFEQSKPKKKGVNWLLVGGIGLVVIVAAVLIGVFAIRGSGLLSPDTPEDDPLADFEVIAVEDLETEEPSPVPVEEEPEEEVAAAQDEEIYLRLWTTEIEESGLQYVIRLANAFTAEHPEVTIDVLGKSFESIGEEFQHAKQEGDPPELLWGMNDTVILLKEDGLIQPAEPYFDMSMFVSLDELRGEDGHTWGIPISVGNHLMLLYNKDMIAEPPATVEELIALGDTFNNGEFALVYAMNEPYFFIPWLAGFGGGVFTDDKVTLNTQATIDALQFLYDLKFTHHVVPEWIDYAGANDFFMDGKAAMIINGDWSLLQYTDYYWDRLGVAPLPKTPVGWSASYVAGDSFFLSVDLKGVELESAIAFINFTLEHGNQLRLAEELLLLPGTLRAYEDPFIWEHPFLSVSAAQYEKGVPMPFGDEMDCVWQTMRVEIEAVLTGEVSPERAAETMQEGAETCIEGL